MLERSDYRTTLYWRFWEMARISKQTAAEDKTALANSI
jgi:hypothetical protein